MFRKIIWCMIGMCLIGSAHVARAEEIYYYLPLTELTLANGGELALPTESPSFDKFTWMQQRNLIDFMYPYAIGQHQEEIYLVTEGDAYQVFSFPGGGAFRMAIRSTDGKPVVGRLYAPKADWSGMTGVDFTATTPAPDQAAARLQFLTAKEQYYRRLLNLRVPGAAWYRHQIRAAQFAREGGAAQTPPISDDLAWQRQSEFESTYDLFSGGRALSENLQLDRELRVAAAADETVPLDSLAGIAVAEIDWKPLIKNLQPQKDALAGLIPADQHVLFFPSFQAMLTVMDEADAQGTPILFMVEARSEDTRTGERYKRQLCLPTSTLSRLLGPELVASVAFTGSDPYLRTGSDVAVLFEAKNAAMLQAAIAARQAEAKTAAADAKELAGQIQGVAYNGLLTPDRAICSYMAVIKNAVVVTNSLAQLEQIVKASQAQIPAVASLDEYTFFRDRYKLGDPEETGLLLITDAAIRRWGGARWRIADSRRTRAAAAFAELQAKYLDELTAGTLNASILTKEPPIPGVGDLRVTPGGIASSVYGALEFLTPIRELAFEKVTQAEADAYARFRDNYQRGWRAYFDPIAVRFSAQPKQMMADVTIRPLIDQSDYREWIKLTGQVEITAQSGDPHPEALAHYVMALDADSALIRLASDWTVQMIPGVQVSLLSWLGKWLTVYLDGDPIWQEAEKAMNEGGEVALSRFMDANYMRLPIAVEIDVSNPLALMTFMAAVRGFIEQTVPGLTQWQVVNYHDQAYVKIGSSVGMTDKVLDIYYAATPQAFIISLNEAMLKRALDRMAARKTGQATAQTGQTWIGKSLGFHVNQQAFDLLHKLSQDEMKSTLERQAWGNLVILNEWHRRYGAIPPVELHQRFWQTTLLCPGGGEYVWNDAFQTMESSVFGHPGQPRANVNAPSPLTALTDANMGVTFENDGLRARIKLKRK